MASLTVDAKRVERVICSMIGTEIRLIRNEPYLDTPEDDAGAAMAMLRGEVNKLLKERDKQVDLTAAFNSLKADLARAEGVCRELRHLIATDGGVSEKNYGTLKPRLEHWLERSTSGLKYERPSIIKPQ